MTFVGVLATLAFQRAAAACPFCGGKGASGLLENLLLVAGLWWGARAVMRSLERRKPKERSAEPDARDRG